MSSVVISSPLCNDIHKIAGRRDNATLTYNLYRAAAFVHSCRHLRHQYRRDDLRQLGCGFARPAPASGINGRAPAIGLKPPLARLMRQRDKLRELDQLIERRLD